jgi:hypothetical protein
MMRANAWCGVLVLAALALAPRGAAADPCRESKSVQYASFLRVNNGAGEGLVFRATFLPPNTETAVQVDIDLADGMEITQPVPGGRLVNYVLFRRNEAGGAEPPHYAVSFAPIDGGGLAVKIGGRSRPCANTPPSEK